MLHHLQEVGLGMPLELVRGRGGVGEVSRTSVSLVGSVHPNPNSNPQPQPHPQPQPQPHPPANPGLDRSGARHSGRAHLAAIEPQPYPYPYPYP